MHCFPCSVCTGSVQVKICYAPRSDWHYWMMSRKYMFGTWSSRLVSFPSISKDLTKYNVCEGHSRVHKLIQVEKSKNSQITSTRVCFCCCYIKEKVVIFLNEICYQVDDYKKYMCTLKKIFILKTKSNETIAWISYTKVLLIQVESVVSTKMTKLLDR